MNALNRPQVVVVDDDYDFQTVLRQWLAPRYDPISIYDGEQLLSELSELDPALIIMDVHLPGPDGFRLCERLRRHPRLRGRPVLFLTASRDNEDFLKNLEAGGDMYLTKPIERARLLREVGALVAA